MTQSSRDNPVDEPRNPGPPPADSAPAGARSFKRITVLAVIACIVGVTGYFYWTKHRDAQAAQQVKALLEPKGVEMWYSDSEPQEGSSFWRQWSGAQTIRIQPNSQKKGTVTDDDLKAIARLQQDLHLVLAGCRGVTDTGLAALAGKRNIRWLELNKTSITDEGLHYLKGMNLETLNLAGTKITDSGLETLGQMHFPRLKELGLQHTHISDAGLAHLAGMTSLEMLIVSDTKVSQKGQDRLKGQIPDLMILSE